VSSDESGLVHPWLESLGDPACGVDIEYDNEYLDLEKAAAGKPETQFGPAEAPDWRSVRSLAESLFGRTRDLRVLVAWTRARLRLEGLPSLQLSLGLITALLERYWDELHPQPDPDDGDPYARLNALSALTDAAAGLNDLRQAVVVTTRLTGALTLREFLVAHGDIAARDDEHAHTDSQLRQMLADAGFDSDTLRASLTGAATALRALDRLLRDRVDYDRVPDFAPIRDGIAAVLALLPAGTEVAPASLGDDASSDDAGADGSATVAASGAVARQQRGPLEAIATREEAQRAIDLICEYLERTEPTNPAQLLLRRARKLISKNFLELVRELAPDALPEVARIMGVDPESLANEDSQY